MTDFLLELRSEEIPARMQAGARADLEKLFRKEMKDAGVSVGGITVYSTPRRLALIAKDLPVQTEAVREETKGPATSAPEQALEGFLRKTGLSKDQLEVRDIKGKDTYFAVVEKPGRAVKDVLADAIPAIIRAFPWPKSQRWGAASLSPESLRWVRPLSGIVAILGDELVECAVEGITSGRVTKGHRFHAPGEIKLSGADTYVETLRAAYVLVDHAERQDLIRTKAAEAASAAGLTLVEDEGLVIENAGLTEWPVPLLGRFDEDFLEVPPETIQLTARVNQKYFVCEKDGKLADAFVCTANIAAVDGGEGIVAGNRKVLAARLSDARFFWEQDRKTPLSKQAEKLGRITFHEKLGTVADKVERVARIAFDLANEGIVPGADPALAKKAARLCKADLVTEMVGEFPELQGLMGGYYARAEGLPDAVADAIRDHYKPVGASDDVPTAPVSVAVALADKLDTLRSFFSIDEKPTGSKDPFALRRAALGVIRILTENGLRLSVGTHDLLDFFADRLKVQQKEAGVRHDLIDAVFALGGEDDLVRLLARVHALQAFVQTDDGANLLAGYKRANNILKKEGFAADERIARTGDEDPMENVDDPDMTEVYAQRGRLSYTPEPAEQALMDALAAAAPKAVACVEAEDFAGAMAALASLRAPIDAFFNDVTVNDSDPAKRTERLGLLDRFRAAVHKVADFSRIEG
ncbi:glycine--tRNA ligase subunit beta [Novosphingobium profundi]|uniref:glycine--tRNA ligase subunit beta n=1 Tax=Novosphingobium profundi TaxID=1774954 RepID=UPI001CFC97F9|nr:glycine--tRNA ligase subunit beta [Novosphingobium profundi]